MSAYLMDLTNLLLRWLHVIAAIAWVGESIYFVMLDNSLKKPQAEADRSKGVAGEMWAVHGGGFYHNQKYQTSPEKLPDDLHWSFWKSYTTWLSGFALFCAMYLSNPAMNLVNPSAGWAWAAKMSSGEAVFMALLFLFGGWLVYNRLCKLISPNMTRDGLLSVAVAVMMVAVSFLATHIFAGKAAFLIIGAVMATCMSANVFFWIIPGQRRMVAAMKAGEAPNPLDGKRGKQRSVHNTYFTLPVVFLMLSNHYAVTYGAEWSWLIAVLFIFAGAAIRQFFVVMHQGKKQYGYWAFGIVCLLLAALLAAPKKPAESPGATEGSPAVSIEQVLAISQQRCAVCHAAQPDRQFGFAAPPLGMKLETAEEIRMAADKFKQRVANHTMPIGNLTGMTEEERALIARWQP
ncbi:urate hydroxylase PuuD [Uruburuella testudinis]|uniref:Urate hydroxylase PuuD n=1 Tax=Uruburuella testudinis TaxID=1282863 RepID=A0ABY4DQG1_9NEIS|nr:urate hydroxylase PuuD [Uruburuella testudinis]UOO81290.1 urate hydroxylase PuuD [Uruburuella testudinis]